MVCLVFEPGVNLSTEPRQHPLQINLFVIKKKLVQHVLASEELLIFGKSRFPP